MSMQWLCARGGGGDSLIKVGTDVRRVQNLGRAQFLQKKPDAQAKKCPASRSLFHSFIKYYTFFVKNCQKPNARTKFISQNLMPGQKLTPEIPNGRARTSVSAFIRESPPPPTSLPLLIFLQSVSKYYF